MRPFLDAFYGFLSVAACLVVIGLVLGLVACALALGACIGMSPYFWYIGTSCW